MIPVILLSIAKLLLYIFLYVFVVIKNIFVYIYELIKPYIKCKKTAK